MKRKPVVLNLTDRELELLGDIMCDANARKYDTEKMQEDVWNVYREVSGARESKICNLIFDLGDVLVTYSSPEFLCRYGISKEEADLFVNAVLWANGSRWHDMDLGLISEKEAVEFYINRFPSCERAARTFFAHMDEWYSDNSETWKLLPLLRKKGYRCYLLSNWHRESYERKIIRMPFIQNINGAVVSGYEGVRKPDPEIYRILLSRYDLDPRECLFFDDKDRNISAGRLLGIHGFRVASQNQLREKLKSLL